MKKYTGILAEDQAGNFGQRNPLIAAVDFSAPDTTCRNRKSRPLAMDGSTAENASDFSDISQVDQPDGQVAALVIQTLSRSETKTLSLKSASSDQAPEPIHVAHFKRMRERFPGAVIHSKRLATIQLRRERDARLKPVPWEKAKFERAPFYAATIIQTGQAVVFTLNFSDDVLHAAGKAKEGAFQNLRRRVSRELKKALGEAPGLVCALDQSRSDRLHIHGMLVATPDQFAALAIGLKRAGGSWTHARGGLHQLHIRSDQWELIGEESFELDRPITTGWAGYMLKIARRLRNETSPSVIYASPQIKERSRATYEKARMSNCTRGEMRDQSILTYD